MVEIKLRNQDIRILCAALTSLMEKNSELIKGVPYLPETESIREGIKTFQAEVQKLHQSILDQYSSDTIFE